MNKIYVSSLIACIIGSQAVAAEMPYALPFNGNNEFSQIGILWAEEVSKATNGEVEFEPVLNSALVTIPETLDAVAGGVIPAGMGVASAMAGAVPAFGYLEMNLSVPVDNPPAEDAMETIFPDVEKLLEPHGVKALWMIPAFGGGFACRDAFIKTVDAWSGVKIRVAGRWQAKQFEAVGASPVSLPASDIYTSLQNGTIDCALITSTIYLSSSLYEVGPYFTDYRFAGNALITIVGNDVWEDMSDESKAIVESVSHDMTVKGTKMLRELIGQAVVSIKEKANYYEVKQEDIDQLLVHWDPLYKEVISGVTDETGQNLVNTLYSYTQ
jgi:TRAP-type transport system periplasmic protein